MNRIVKGNRLEKLADLLAVKLLHQESGDPFLSPEIVVPNLDTARWLQLHIAEKNGFAGNIRYMLPAEWQWDQIRKLYTDLPKSLPADAEPMKWAIYAILKGTDLVQEYPHIHRFAEKQEGSMKDQALLRFSAQISSMFDQYIIYRPEMVLRWQGGKINEEEQWQAKLWNSLQEIWRERGSEGIHFRKNKAELWSDGLEKIRSGDIETGKRLHVFNPGLLPEPVVRMLKAVGDRTDVTIYMISAHQPEPENPLLVSLGEEMAATTALCRQTGFEEESLPPPDFPDSDLGRIQRSVAENCRHTGLEKGTLPEGIRIHSCHSELREAETLHRYLLGLFSSRPDLNPDDVLVVMPDTQRYESAIHAVFGHSNDGLPQIPYHAGSTASAGEYALHRSFLMLLSLPGSRFRFQDVMDLFQTPAVLEKAGLIDDESARVKRWMEENHVTWGADDSHRRESGQPGGSPRTWQAAVRRVWLGQLLPAPAGDTFDGELCYHSLSGTAEYEVWAGFASFLSALTDFREATKRSLSSAEWVDQVEHLIQNVFSKKSLESLEYSQISRSLKTIRDVAELSGFSEKVTWKLFADELKKLADTQRPAGARFTRGVTFSTMVPVRSMPFRVIAMIGLNESDFPRTPTAPGFDLMARFPKPTERNRKNEDRNLFLESILSSKEEFYISYIGRSRQDNEAIPPSPIVGEWLEFLSGETGIKPEKLIREEPLTIFSPDHFRKGEIAPELHRTSALSILTPGERPEGLVIDEDDGDEEEDVQATDLSDLTSFVRLPVRHFVTRTLGAVIPSSEEEKPEFQLNALERHILFRKVFDWVLSERDDSALLEMVKQSGIVPEGWPGEQEVQSLIRSAGVALNPIRDAGFEPNITSIDVDIRTNLFDLSGSVTSFSEDRFLDIKISSLSGKLLTESWISHIVWNLSKGTDTLSTLCCELKKGDPKLVRFTMPESPEEVLGELIDLYREGQIRPLRFFPSTLYEYAVHAEKDESKAIGKATTKFVGGSFSEAFGERDNEYVKLIFGSEPAFDPELLKPQFLEPIIKMRDHTEVDK